MNSRFQPERRRPRSLPMVAALGLMILAAGSIEAGVIRVGATAISAYPGHQVVDDSGLLEAVSTAAAAASFGFFPSGVEMAFGDAVANSNASLGTLGAYTYALTTDRNFTSYTATADATAQFRDLLTVMSTSLPFGSPVSLNFTMTLSGLISATGGAINGHALSDYLAMSNLSVDVGRATGGLSVSGTGTVNSQNNFLSRVLTLDAHVGDRMAIDGFMQVHAWSALTGTTSSDFSSTAHFYGDSLVQGVKLIGETGRDYSSLLVEAPEPVSGLLVLIGVLLFGTGKLRTWEQKLNFFRMFDAAASTTRLSRCKGTVAVSLLVTLSYVSYGQTGAAPEVMAAGDPPLTRPMAQTICAVMGWLLDIRFNAEQRDHITAVLVRDWKSGDRKDIESDLDWLRLAIAIKDKSAGEREAFRRQTAPRILQMLRADGQSSDAAWLLAQYEAAQQSNEQTRTIGTVSFVPAPGWQYAGQPGMDFATIARKGGAGQCRLAVYKAFRSSGDQEADFHLAWEHLFRRTKGFPEPSFKMGHRSLAGYSGTVGCTSLINTTGRPDNLCLTVLRAGEYTIPVERFSTPDASACSEQMHAIDMFLDGVRLSPDQAKPQRKPVSVAELVGTWYHGSDSNQIYVYLHGGYAGSSTIVQGETVVIKADGSFSSSYAGSWNAVIVREQAAGTVEFSNERFVLRKEGKGITSYRLISYQQALEGATVMTLLEDRYEANAANINSNGEKWVRKPTGK